MNRGILTPTRFLAADKAKEFERRRARLRISRKQLAELAGMDQTALGQFLNARHREVFASTVEKIDNALAREERRLRMSLRSAAR